MERPGFHWLPVVAAALLYATWSGCSTTGPAVESDEQTLPSGESVADAAASANHGDRPDADLPLYESNLEGGETARDAGADTVGRDRPRSRHDAHAEGEDALAPNDSSAGTDAVERDRPLCTFGARSRPDAGTAP